MSGDEGGDNGAPHVFVSYSHDSPSHIDNVIDFAQELRREGFDTWIDHFVEPPPPSWPRWMEDEIDRADYVLTVCSEIYLRRFKGEPDPAPLKGLGVRWEGLCITQDIYENTEGQGPTWKQKFIPVVVKEEDAEHIPRPLKPRSRYVIGTIGNRNLEPLLRHLSGQPLVVPEPLGPIRSLPPLGAVVDTTDKQRRRSLMTRVIQLLGGTRSR